MNTREKAFKAYLNNPLAHTFADVLIHGLKITDRAEREQAIVDILGSEPLLLLLDRQMDEMAKEALRLVLTPPETWIKCP